MTTRRTRRTRSQRLIASFASRGLQPARKGVPVLALLAAVASLAGCYERVVDASGPNAGSADVQPGYRSDTWLDRAVFPDKGKEESGFGATTAERQRAYLRNNKAN
ncbi:MAG: hypothetical protein K2Y21_00470 [Phycisphaerales bacterium]|nr:hypothetical protein [Phycisphaerales bacterium]